MNQKDFNKNLDGYLNKRRILSGDHFNFSDVLANFKFKKKERKFKEVEIDSTETVVVDEEPGFFAKINKWFKRKKPEVVDEVEMEEEKDFEVPIGEPEELKEMEENLEEIEEIEQRERSKVGKLRNLLNKLKFLNRVRHDEAEDLEEEMEIQEIKKDATANDVQALIDFSVGLLQKLTAKEFRQMKDTPEFIEYKEIVKKYVKKKEEVVEGQSLHDVEGEGSIEKIDLGEERI
ncbi:hypothetical protein H8D36_05905 [archaeon]|nr:hypothetical protein [archaeon]MBL7051197.1 hypothetical protein [Candidatus Woesearchaeota archaeon]